MLHDDDFTHCVQHATEVVARIWLNYETKTVKSGALFYQEVLPAETLLYAVVLASDSRKKECSIKSEQRAGWRRPWSFSRRSLRERIG